MMTLSHVERVQNQLPGALLLALVERKKRPKEKEWSSFGIERMADLAYLSSLLHGNVGVALGPVSGGLYAFDFDRDEDAATWLAGNPWAGESFRTRGARGCQVWAYIEADCPPSGNLKDATGQIVCEWRGAGRQSVVWGTHPTGVEYQWIVANPPVKIPGFHVVQWGDWRGPWMPEPEDAGILADRELIKEHGEPYTKSDKGKLTLNPMYHVARFARSGDTLFEPGEGSFYGYDPELGLWQRRTEAAIKIDLAESLKEYADFLDYGDGRQIVNARTAPALAGMAGLLQGFVEETNAFNREHGVIHVANGMLHLGGSEPKLQPFAAEYRSRNVAPVAYDPAAECPRFRRELLESALNEADVFLVQRFCGVCLMGGNTAQKMLVLTGTAGGGKSTLLEILEKILGLGCVRSFRIGARRECTRA